MNRDRKRIIIIFESGVVLSSSSWLSVHDPDIVVGIKSNKNLGPSIKSELDSVFPEELLLGLFWGG